MEHLPFNVKKVDDHLVVSTKPKHKLNRHEKRAFEKNKVNVTIALFDQEYFDRMNNVKVVYEEDNSLRALFKNIQFRIVRFINR